jgi:hypothetical protein
LETLNYASLGGQPQELDIKSAKFHVLRLDQTDYGPAFEAKIAAIVHA